MQEAFETKPALLNYLCSLVILSSLLALLLLAADASWATVGDIAIYWPGVGGMLTPKEQEECANYIYTHVNLVQSATKTLFCGFGQDTVKSFKTWLDAHLRDGQADLVIIIDICPKLLYGGEVDRSMAEQWMKSGNMLIWTGSEPFGSYIDTEGICYIEGICPSEGAGQMGASWVLDVSSAGLCRGVGRQEATTAVRDWDDPDGDYDIGSFVEYEAQHALRYDQLLIDALSSNWHQAPFWRPEEIFAEDSEQYQSDCLVLVNEKGGRYGQFYCLAGFNQARMRVISEVINHWLSLPCRTLVVPSRQYPTIQSAINAAQSRDTVVVMPGTYREQLVLKRGVKLVSDWRGGGNNLVPGPGQADKLYGVESKKVLARASRTIIDGTGFSGGVEARPMIDFPPGATVATLVDGFTITHMPRVDHTLPGHAHTVQMRGASGTVINCIICENGSSGLGCHALMKGEESSSRDHRQIDFRYSNIKYDSHPIVINNVVCRNEGNNLGNNHYAYAIFYNNECFESLSVDGHDAPGIGNQHGAHALIVGNLVYQSAWVGIGARQGEEQGRYPVNRPTHPTVRKNRVYDSGQNYTCQDDKECGAGIGADDTGGFDPKLGRLVYHLIEDNYVSGSANAGIGCRSTNPTTGYVRIVGNEVTQSGRLGWGAGIGIRGATHVAAISRNVTYGNRGPGIGLREGAACELISNNESFENEAAGIGLREGAKVVEISHNDLHDNRAAGCGHEGSQEGGRVWVRLEYGNRIRQNRGAGLGIVCSDVVEIRDNLIEHNDQPGITLMGGSTVGLIVANTLDYNGASCKASLSAHEGSSATIKDTLISHSGAVGISAFDPETSLLLEGCTITDSGQCSYGPNLTAQAGAKVQLVGCSLERTLGSPNIMVSGGATTLSLVECTVRDSAKPGLVASSDAKINIRNTTFDRNGTDGTRGLMIDGCEIVLERVTVCNSPHYALAATNCTGRIEGCEFYRNGLVGGGQITIIGSRLSLIRNLLHDPGGYHNQIALLSGSDCKVYHNTIVGKADGKAGALNQGPGDGLYVDGTSRAEVRNNIFSCLPRGIGQGVVKNDRQEIAAKAFVLASSNCFHQMSDFSDKGIVGQKIILADPQLTKTYSLGPNSPCLDAAELIRGVNDAFRGAGPDIGAKEN